MAVESLTDGAIIASISIAFSALGMLITRFLYKNTETKYWVTITGRILSFLPLFIGFGFISGAEIPTAITGFIGCIALGIIDKRKYEDEPDPEPS